jgi:hypothetical protein
MNIFGVEVDCYRESTGSGVILVPRVAFVPSWITGPNAPTGQGRAAGDALATASPDFWELVGLMNRAAEELGFRADRRRTGWNYVPRVLEEGGANANYGIGVYATTREVEINLTILRERGCEELAEDILTRLRALSGEPLHGAQKWPSVSYGALLHSWELARSEVIAPYFRARSGRGVETT